MDRRNFIKMMSILSGSAAYSCSLQKSPKKLIPYIVPPEDGVIPGEPQFVATSCMECLAGCGVQVRLRDGIPVKLEGLRSHPDNSGALCVRGQASLERLYSPDRLTSPRARQADGSFAAVTWEEALGRIAEAREVAAGRQEFFWSGRTNGSLAALIGEYCGQFTAQRVPEFERYGQAPLRAAYKSLFGIDALPYFDVGAADSLLTFGAGIIETFVQPVRFAREVADLLARDKDWHHFEPHLSISGTAASQRHALAPNAVPLVLAFLLRQVPMRRQIPGEWMALVPDFTLEQIAAATGITPAVLNELAATVTAAQSPLVIAGDAAVVGEAGFQSALFAGLAQFAWGTIGQTVDFARVEVADHLGTPADALDLRAHLAADEVGLFTLTRIHDLSFIPGMADAVRRAGLVVVISDFMTPVAKLADVILPVSHSLEAWGDTMPRLGLAGAVRPALQPLHDTRSEGDILLGLMARPESYEEYLALQWEGRPGSWVEDGFAVLPTAPVEVTLAGEVPALPSVALDSASNDGAWLIVTPSLRFFDGRSVPLNLLHEIPEPLSSVTYGAYVSIAEGDAAVAGVVDGDEVVIDSAAGPLVLPARIQVGLPSGRFVVDAVSAGTFPLATVLPFSGEFQQVFGAATLHRVGTRKELPVLSGSNRDGEERGMLPRTYEDEHHHHLGEETLFPDHPHDTYRWGMVIDLDKCSGCSACVAACYVENNVAVVGKEEHLRGREMSWLRLEPYIQRNGLVEILPVMCQQCDHAPCETVCPVYATYHSPEGLNAQVYNRCVGTRYCANNCPYKVRRFNWFEHERKEPYDQMLNPDVSDRPVGVMEKCSFCLQRIRRAKDIAKDEARDVRDGEVMPACAQTCPAGAISFGNLMDQESRVAGLARLGRAFRTLGALGTRPAVIYLKKSRANLEHGAAAERGKPHKG